jgi:hypothetical protein
MEGGYRHSSFASLNKTRRQSRYQQQRYVIDADGKRFLMNVVVDEATVSADRSRPEPGERTEQTKHRVRSANLTASRRHGDHRGVTNPR